jgi:hypothetical protein
MPDEGTVESVASKFQAWAESLTPEEQGTLANWWENIRPDDRDEVEAHSADDWWNQDGAWSRAWADSWSWW